MSFPDLLYRIAHDSPGAVPALAARMAKNPTVLQNKLNPHCRTHGVMADEAEQIIDFSGCNLMVAEYFAGKAGAVVVPLTAFDGSDMALLDGFMTVLADLGNFSTEFQRDWADGRIDKEEFARLRQQAQTVQSHLYALLDRIGQLVER